MLQIVVLQIVGLQPVSFWMPALGVAVLTVAFVVLVAGNKAVEASQRAMAVVKILGAQRASTTPIIPRSSWSRMWQW